MNKAISIIANISTIISILVFIYPLTQDEEIKFTTVQKIFFILSIAICIAYVIYEVTTLPKKYKDDTQIKNYMKNWVKKTGRTVIFTRDMSWANDTEIKNELTNKARSQELIICLPKSTTLTRSLKNDGAEIYTYENLNFTPKSRFTFINYGSNSSKVAIGRKDDSHNHIITEYTTKDTIEYFLAEDLVNLIKNIT